MKILHIDASARSQGSYSRTLSAHFVEELQRRIPLLEIDRLDLTKSPPRHFGELETAAIYTDPDEHTPAMRAAIADSDKLVSRTLSAGGLVVGSPIYNFGMPTTLKAFFDHVSRPGKTFESDENGIRGLLGGKKVAVLSAAGGAYGPGEMFEGRDLLTPHITAILDFLGITDLSFIAARPLMLAAPDEAERAMSLALERATELARTWSEQANES